MADIPTNGEVNFNILFNGEDGGSPSNDNENEGTPAAPSNVGKPNSGKSTESSAKNVALSAGVNVAMNLGKQAVNAAVSNISAATGDYVTQQRVQQSLSAAGTAVGLISSFSNPFTAIAAVGALAISTGAKIWQEQNRLKWNNIDAANKAKLYGYASSEGR